MADLNLADELSAIKKLLILQLVRSGVTTDDIGRALGVSGQRIRQLVPARQKGGPKDG
jgi:hypothetical protein